MGSHSIVLAIALAWPLTIVCVFAVRWIRTLRKGIAGYHKVQKEEGGLQKETGWKLLHGEASRPTPNTVCACPMLLSVLVGTGTQVGFSFVLALILCNVMHPMATGQFLTSVILLYALCGSIAGYWSIRIYALCHRGTPMSPKDRNTNALATAAFLPCLLGIMLLALNFLLEDSSMTRNDAATYISARTGFILFLIWGGISLPLVVLGAWIGTKVPAIELPTETNLTVRAILNPGRLRRISSLKRGGVALLPFLMLAPELPFVLKALRSSELYYPMGFSLTLVVLSGTMSCFASIWVCQIELSAEDHWWWWKPFWNAGTAGAFFFAFVFLCLIDHLRGWSPVMVCLIYTGMISIAFGLFCGSLGFLSTLWFVRTIYGAVKVESDCGAHEPLVVLVEHDGTNKQNDC